MPELAIHRFRLGETPLEEIVRALRPPIGERYARQAEQVRRIVRDVADRGDDALLEYVRKYDWPEATASRLEITEAEIDDACASIPTERAGAVERAAAAVRGFHEHSVPATWTTEGRDRVLGQRVRALRTVGMYVPGGIPLPSSVYMCAIPAKVAGVGELVMVTPSGRDGSVDPLALFAARVSGVDRVFRIGSAWSIAALAYGTETVPRVDKVVGPGGIWVMLAMREVFGQVGVDSLPGPSDVLVISDGSQPASWVAADLLSQAEHGENSSAVLVSTDAAHLAEVESEIVRLASELATGSRARASLADRGALIHCADLAECASVAEAIAPEHLEILVAEGAEELAEGIASAGAIFFGGWTPEPIGDYVAGPSHVLPTEGSARYLSPLGVESFLKRTSLLRFGREALREAGPDAVILAEAEGLEAHARSVALRLEALAAPAQRDRGE